MPASFGLQVNASENIVGWFATGESSSNPDVNEYSVLIHDYYARETATPVHLTVNPTTSGISVKAYVSTPFGVPNKSMGTMFSPVSCLTKAAGYETELIGLKASMAASGIPNRKPLALESEVEMILAASAKCSDNITVLMNFIDEHVLNPNAQSSKLAANANDIGRQLMAMVESITPFGADDEQLNTTLKDLLMVIYLANLSKTQLMLNEKLSLL